MASRKEQKERLRREREERERAAAAAKRRRRLIGYGVGGALAVLAAVVLVVVLAGNLGGGGESEARSNLLPDGGRVPELRDTDVAKAAKAGDCELKSEKTQAREHTADPNETVKYASNPPTSGRHYQEPAADSAYTQAPADTATVHALEHGRVNLWFKPSASRQGRADLKALYDRDKGYQLLVLPRPKMPYQLAATAWNRDPEPNGTGRFLGCRAATPRAVAALQAFIEEHRSNGPEPVP